MAESHDLVASFEEFFDSHYKKEAERLAGTYPKKKSLEVSYAELAKYDPDIADELVANPDPVIESSRKALSAMNLTLAPGVKFEPYVRFFGLPDSYRHLVKDVGAEHINRLISVDGIVTKATEVRPKVRIAVFECTHCGATPSVAATKNLIEPPAVCECGRRSFKFLESKCKFIDLQRIEIQESLERLKGGATAQHIEVWLEDDLTNEVVPGQKVEITGIMRIRPPKGREAVYVKFLEGVNMKKIEREFEELDITDADVTKIKALSVQPDIYDKLIQSMAPSIYGYNEIKEAIVLQLFGGTPRKPLPDGTAIRNDIHVLLIGDPGSAKTQLLLYVAGLAPKSVYVSGKSVSGAGLTASAEKDEMGDGGWTLKAGALVLASGGMAAVDEFDKIDKDERSAMHEVMESGTVSVAKAGIVARFKAKTAILAAANPKLGRFDPYKLPAEQFDIPPTLLSRFDLIFPIKDVLDEVKDRKLAEHIIIKHRAHKGSEEIKRIEPPIDPELMKKYIAYARTHVYP